jgi:hypothetical protein
MNTIGSLDRRALVRCIESASLAPSLHNSQPWRFRIDGTAIEVYADRARQLRVLDPAGRAGAGHRFRAPAHQPAAVHVRCRAGRCRGKAA